MLWLLPLQLLAAAPVMSCRATAQMPVTADARLGLEIPVLSACETGKQKAGRAHRLSSKLKPQLHDQAGSHQMACSPVWRGLKHGASSQKHPVVCCPTGLKSFTAAYDLPLASTSSSSSVSLGPLAPRVACSVCADGQQIAAATQGAPPWHCRVAGQTAAAGVRQPAGVTLQALTYGT